jgi:hypothetical protein
MNQETGNPANARFAGKTKETRASERAIAEFAADCRLAKPAVSPNMEAQP